MNTQTLANNTMIRNLFSLPIYIPQSHLEISAQELGYEINEDEVANELGTQLPEKVSWQPIPEVEPEEFETVYKWFLS